MPQNFFSDRFAKFRDLDVCFHLNNVENYKQFMAIAEIIMRNVTNTEKARRSKKEFMAPITVCRRFNVSRTTLWRWQKSETIGFPRPIKITHNIVRWDKAEIEAWEARQVAAANGEAAAA
jgi:predicted DNA-binding transcriptional regulator AlpA